VLGVLVPVSSILPLIQFQTPLPETVEYIADTAFTTVPTHEHMVARVFTEPVHDVEH
jgi:hypothetical protein